MLKCYLKAKIFFKYSKLDNRKSIKCQKKTDRGKKYSEVYTHYLTLPGQDTTTELKKEKVVSASHFSKSQQKANAL